MEDKKDTIEINGKSILYALAIALIFLLVLVALGIVTINFGGKANGNAISDYNSLPEKCKPAAGYDIESWKEHLGHHAETQECLKYFD